MDFIFNEEPKKLVLTDIENKREIILLYKDPTAEEKIKYGSAIGSIFRGKAVEEVEIEEILKVQFRFGFEILIGIEVKGIAINISADPQSPDYRPEWKKLITDRSPDLAIILAREVFEVERFNPSKN